MNKAPLYFCVALAGIILFQFLFYKCDRREDEKQIASLQQQLYDCVHAPVKSDTVVRRDTLKQVIYLPFTHKVIDTVNIRTTEWLDCPIEQSEYTGTYIHPQFELHWTANVTGVLNSMTINPPSLIKSLIITKEKTVDLTQYQTNVRCEKSHLYTNIGAGFWGKQFNSADVSLMYIRREGWGLSAGIGTDFDKLIYKGGLILRLK
jgi:hypothetical protein